MLYVRRQSATLSSSTGDLEALLKLNTYCQTASCTRHTAVFQLDIQHFRRLFDSRQGQKTGELLMRRLQMRLAHRLSRLTPTADKSLSVLFRLQRRVDDFVQHYDQRESMVINKLFYFIKMKILSCFA